jgi:hypothetical protein
MLTCLLLLIIFVSVKNGTQRLKILKMKSAPRS